MQTGSFPTASTYGTWLENIELRSIDDDTLWDTSGLTEVIVKLRDPRTGWDELVLKYTDGSVVLPAPGIIQWRAEVTAMGMLAPKVYEVIILLMNATDTVPLVIGTVSVIGEGVMVI